MSRQAYRGEILHFLADPREGADAIRHFDDGVLIVEDGHIVEAAPWNEEAIHRLQGAPVEHFEDGLIVPGFIDAHVHYPQVDIVASPGNRLLEWLSNYTFPCEARYSHKEVAREAARFFLDRLLAGGVTSALVFATAHKVSAEALFEEAYERGMRLITGKVLMDANVSPGVSDTAETGYQETKSLIAEWHGKGRLGYAVTPRFALTSSERQLQLAGRLLAEHPGVLLHTHLSENVEEVAAVGKMFPSAPDYFGVYERFGLAGPHSVFAHCIHLPDNAWTRFGAAGSAAAFCPSSNLFLGSGLFDIAAARKAGVRVALGSDVGAGTSLAMLATMADAYKVCQLKRRAADAFDLFYLATLSGAKALHIDGYVGNFEAGKEADFTVLDASGQPLLARRLGYAKKFPERLFAFAVLGGETAVSRTYVAGKLAYARAPQALVKPRAL
jgi:guanine deaminase